MNLLSLSPFSRRLYLVAAAAALLFVAPAPRLINGQTAVKPDTGTAATDKCEVCHNGKNPHTVSISCDKVNQYLANHPGDYAGPCQGMTKEKPPKGSPTPKPHH